MFKTNKPASQPRTLRTIAEDKGAAAAHLDADPPAPPPAYKEDLSAGVGDTSRGPIPAPSFTNMKGGH